VTSAWKVFAVLLGVVALLGVVEELPQAVAATKTPRTHRRRRIVFTFLKAAGEDLDRHSARPSTVRVVTVNEEFT